MSAAQYPQNTHTHYAMTIETHNLGLNLLRLAPLVLSTASLMCGVDQANALRPFSKPPLAKTGGSVLPHWFSGFFDTTIYAVGLSYPLAFATALLNAGKYVGDLDDTTRYLYWAGAAFSAGHFLYGPGAMQIIARMCDKENPGVKNTQTTHEWLDMNFTRIITVDGPAWIMYFAAVLSAASFP